MSNPNHPDPLKSLDERIKAAKVAKTPEPKVDDHYTGAQLAWRMVIELVAGIAIGFGIGYGLDALLNTMRVFFVIFILLGLAAGVKTMLRTAQEVQIEQMAKAEEEKED